MKKSYYLPDGRYFDTTRGIAIEVKRQCELCGATYPITQHHYLEQQKALKSLASKKVRYPKMWTKEFIDEKQQIFCLCLQCHTDVHSMSNERFYEKYGIEREKFIYLD